MTDRSPQRQTPPPPRIERDLPMPMRDGTILRADLWATPTGEPRPVLICRTPYGKSADETEQRLAAKAVERGYAVLLQDVRGRHASDGIFDPLRNEGRDGFDSIEWTAAQPWCDGRVGSFGLSYPGCAQWLAALENPPHLLALAPAMSHARLRDAVRYGGVLDADWLRWAWLYIAPDMRRRQGLPGPKTVDEALEDWERLGLEERFAAPLLGNGPDVACMQEVPDMPELAELLRAAPFLARWLAEPHASPWWDFGDVVDRIASATAAVLHLDGWLDDACGPRGAIACHAALSASRSPARSRLVMGPWSHGVPAVTGHWREGGRDFGPEAFLDYDALVLDFMDEHVRGLDRGRTAPVRYFVMGENRWREAGTWPQAPLREHALHFAPGGTLTPQAPHSPAQHNQAQHSPAQHSQAVSAFDNDPARPVHALPARASSPAEQAAFLAEHAGRLLAFESAPLAQALTVIGEVRAELFVSVDAPDADLFLILQDVAPDGTACLLMDPRAGALRLSQAAAGSRPGEALRVELGGLWTANSFLPGHRVRALICASWSPALAPNPQTGGNRAGGNRAGGGETGGNETDGRTRPARITLHHCPGAQSRIIFPLAENAPGTLGQQNRKPEGMENA